MKHLVTIVLLIGLCSCENNPTERSELLTSFTWVMDTGAPDKEMNTTERYTFRKDGTFYLESGEVRAFGTWKWNQENEIHLRTDGIVINGQSNRYDKSFDSNMRVLQLANRELRTLEKSEGDDWDSGFAKERSYRALNF